MTSIITNTCIIINFENCLLLRIYPQKPSTHFFKKLYGFVWGVVNPVFCVVGMCGQAQNWPGTITTRWAASPARSSTATVGPRNAGADYYNIKSHLYFKFFHETNYTTIFLLNSICYTLFCFFNVGGFTIVWSLCRNVIMSLIKFIYHLSPKKGISVCTPGHVILTSVLAWRRDLWI